MDDDYIDEEAEDEAEEERQMEQAEAIREAGQARAKDDRAFYDGLAKQEDDRHRAMELDMRKRSLAVGELHGKMRHKETELHALDMKLRIINERLEYEAKMKYIKDANGPAPDGTIPEEPIVKAPIPILTKDIPKEEADNGFSTERALSEIKDLEFQKAELQREIDAMKEGVSVEERALSQIHHQLMRF